MGGKYVFTKESRKAYEDLPTSLAIYQYLNGKLYPQIFSDGICETTGKKREELYEITMRELFGMIHISDINKLVESTYNCICHDEVLNMMIRSKLRKENEYTLVSCKGYNKVMEDDSKLFFMEFSELNKADCEGEQFRDLLDNSPNGIILVDIKNKDILYHNDAVDKLLGDNEPESKGMKCFEYLFNRSVSCENCPLEGEETNNQTKFCKAENKLLSIKSEKLDWKDSKVFALYINESEATDNKTDAVAENSVFEADSNGKIRPVRIAKSYSKLVGTKQDEHFELLNENICADMFFDDGDKFKADIFNAIETKKYEYDKVYKLIDRRDNSYKPVKITGVAIPKSDGKFLILANHVEERDIKTKEGYLSEAIKFTGIQYIEWYVKDEKLYITVYDNKNGLKKRLISENPYSKTNISAFVHSSYVDEYFEEVNKLRGGTKEETQIDVLCLNTNGLYEWQRHYMTVTEKDENGLPLIIVGTYSPVGEMIELEENFGILLKQYGLSTWVYYPDKHIAKTFINGKDEQKENIFENFPEEFVNTLNIDEEDLAIIREAYKKLEEGQPEVEFTIKLNRGGSLKWIKTNYTSLFNDKGELKYALGSSLDVTTEINLKKEYNEAYNLHKESGDGTIATTIYNVDKDEIVYSKGRNNYFDVPTDLTYDERIEFISSYAANSFDKDWIIGFKRNNCLKLYGEGKRSLSKEIIYETDQGKLWLVESIKLIKNPENGNLMMFITTEDNTQKHETELFLKFLATNSYDFSIIINMKDEQYNYMFYYPKAIGLSDFETRHGKNFFTMAKRELFKHLKAENADSIQKILEPNHLMSRLENEDPFVYIYNGEINGERFVKKLIITYYDKENKEIGMIQQDVTSEFAEEEKTKKQLSTALNEIKRVNNIKDDFLGRMSHDMRTPMNAIIGISNFGIEEINDEKAVKYFNQIKESSNYLLGLLNDILDMQKLEFGSTDLKHEVVKVPDAIESNKNIIKVRAEEKGINFEMNYDDSEEGLEYIYIDGLRLNQIMLNLLNNAIKYTPSGGHVKWEIKTIKKGDGYELYSTISDNGIGMSDEFKSDLYTPFVRENERMTSSEGGVGLGLAITKKLVDLMEGEISCDSKKDIGTTFFVKIPVDIPDDKSINKYNDRNRFNLSCENNLIGKKVLLCEDIDINAKIAGKILETFGMIITYVKDGSSAVKMAESEDFDVVLMDIHMPIMDGLTAAKRIREFDKKIPVVALSANAYKKDIDNSLEAGMNCHLAKPIDKHKLIFELCRLIK